VRPNNNPTTQKKNATETQKQTKREYKNSQFADQAYIHASQVQQQFQAHGDHLSVGG
jgi:dsRNA-specific ribonuclease